MTTRFPRDAATRYAREPDFAAWSDRLEIFGLDLRHTPSVEAFCSQLIETRERLDFIINNACQTVRRPPDFYQHMMENETAAMNALPSPARKLLGSYEGLRGDRIILPVSPAELSQVPLLPEELAPQNALFPRGRLDRDLQQIDLRARNSWRLLLDEVSSVELLAKYTARRSAGRAVFINARLKRLMMRKGQAHVGPGCRRTVLSAIKTTRIPAHHG